MMVAAPTPLTLLLRSKTRVTCLKDVPDRRIVDWVARNPKEAEILVSCGEVFGFKKSDPRRIQVEGFIDDLNRGYIF